MSTGQCLCGNVKYETSEAPTVLGVCHCKNCQRQGGSAFSTIAGIALSELHINGVPKLYEDSNTFTGNTVKRFFCGDCGSPIYSLISAQPDVAYLKTGTLDDTDTFAPQFHVWCSTKQLWVELSDSTPAFDKNPG